MDVRDWAGLPRELSFNIANRLTVIDDYVSFGRVCAPWQTIYREIFTNSIFLLVAPREEEGDDDYYYRRRALYNVSNKRVYDLHAELPHNKFCCGFSFGWLVTVESKGEDSYGFQLQNPFLGRTINLPSLHFNPEEPNPYAARLRGGSSNSRCKVALSSDPSLSHDFTAVGIICPYLGLAFCKPGNPTWTPIALDGIRDLYQDIWFQDVIYFRNTGKFYAVHNNGSVFTLNFNFGGRDPKFVQIAPPAPRQPCDDQRYLVEDLSSGELLQISLAFYSCGLASDTDTDEEENTKEVIDEENSEKEVYCSKEYTVFKFDLTNGSWIKIDNLGDKVLFVGNNCSILRSASDCPGCEPNHIYYHIDRDWNGNDWKTWYGSIHDAIYNLEKGTIRPHYSLKSTKVVSSSIWLEPTLRI